MVAFKACCTSILKDWDLIPEPIPPESFKRKACQTCCTSCSICNWIESCVKSHRKSRRKYRRSNPLISDYQNFCHG